MRGRLTAFWILLAAGVGFGLFHVKYKVQSLEDELARLDAAIVKEERQIRVLNAEWSHLNRPDRIAEMATRHLQLTPITAGQIRTLDALPPRAETNGDPR